MSKWNYLKFNKDGEPHRDNAKPKEGTFIWGFCGEDHRVLLCYAEPNFGIDIVDPFTGMDDDAYIIAWAEIEQPTMPDINELRVRKTLRPPIISLESAQWYLADRKRSFKRSGETKSKAEAKRRLQTLKRLQDRVDEKRKVCTVVENGYHIPPENERRGRRYEYAIQTR